VVAIVVLRSPGRTSEHLDPSGFHGSLAERLLFGATVAEPAFGGRWSSPAMHPDS
jgi:hypothetical protein